MSYVYFPPRTSNYFPGGPPYLSGLRGLGDAASDQAAYKKALTAWKIDHLKWLQEKSLYTTKFATYNRTVKDIETEYSMNLAAYNAALSDYYTAYAGAKRGYTERSLAVAAGYHLNLPKSYYDGGACLTQAQHDAYAKNCTTVKGLGRWGLGSNDTDCGMAKLPICGYPTKPEPPTKGKYPKAPTLRSEPAAPKVPVIYTPPVVTTPAPVPSGGGGGGGSGGGGGAMTPTPTPETPVTVPGPDPKQAGVLMNGLIIVAVLGGGYLVYRTLKKPKAAA